ncbi:MAG: phosphate/phosphite/phosphonate ABC transporter substrate-binding protein [Rhodoferax sp.]|uniref:phosphate/phosphite/phosphonate ABC transporter substrate-binding protein n=1 Tax=Rhodoferax sp. TaxID=50421 RepID=UPI003264C66A
MHFIFRLASQCILLLGLVSPAWGQQTLTFAIVPQQSATQLAEAWTPVLAWLSQSSGLHLQFVTAPDVPSFEQRLTAGEYDVAYMNPYHYTVFSAHPGYRALSRAKGDRIKGIVVVKKDSPVKSLSDLAGKTLAFPTPAAFAASLLVQAELRGRGIAFTPKIVNSHNSVYRSVAKGLFPGGGGIPRTLELLDESVRSELRVLWETREFTPHAIATRPGLDAAVRAQLWKAMREMGADPRGQELLKGIGFTGFEAAKDEDWDDVRSLKIRPEDAHLKIEP